ncbi:MAG: hypothetical protein LBR84_11970 [Tannerella sp.]|jgi:hypothetical protein|nr:hypothetical protein [Tannerella sp.]
MSIEKNKLDELRGRNPFRVPGGYFEHLTDDIMSRLPEKTVVQPKVVSFYDRVKPLLYMAAAFAGVIILFNVLNKTADTSPDSVPAVVAVYEEVDEDEEFLDYIEDMYADKYAVSYIGDYFNEN